MTPKHTLDPQLCVDLWNRNKAMTQDQIALVLGCSRAKIDYIEKRALAKIRDALIQTRALERKVGV